MAKKKRKGYLPKNHTKERRDYIDYDYINKLSEEDKEWLSRFTDEEYGASFEVNPIFVKYADLNEEFKEKVQNNTLYYGEFVQIYKNKDQKNLDLRKLRSITQYYMKNDGSLTKDPSYRYSKNNISNPNDRTRMNRKVKDMRNDLWNVGLKDEVSTTPESFNNTNVGRKATEHHELDEREYDLSYEDYIIFQEDLEIQDDIDSKD